MCCNLCDRRNYARTFQREGKKLARGKWLEVIQLVSFLFININYNVF